MNPPPLTAFSGRSWPSHTTTVLLALIAARLFNALTIRTYFQADEYFQALEPAWLIAFGPETSPWITWEWKMGLRSSLHPRLFAIVYLVTDHVLKAAGLSPRFTAGMLIAVPKIIQGVLAAFGDWYTWRLAKTIYSDKQWVPEATLLMTVASPWQWFVSTRTFSNSLETVLTVTALYYWPWRLFADAKQQKIEPLRASGELTRLRVSLLLAAVAVLLRPTNILVWLSICAILLTRFTLEGKSPIDTSVLIALVREAVFCGGITLAISAVSDRLFYQEWVFPPYNFLYFNLVQSLADFYGQNDWHYYLSQGIPILSFGVLPFVLYGLWKTLSPISKPRTTMWTGNILRTLGFAVVVLMGSLSLIAHKEVRFIYPLLPIFHVLAAPYMVSFFIGPVVRKPTNNNTPPNKATTLRRKPGLAVVLTVNFIVGVYLSYIHVAAPMAAVDFLRHEWEVRHPQELSLGSDVVPKRAASRPDSTEDLFAVFLMPCHTSPWRSHLVYSELSARSLSCSPPVDTRPGSEERRNYQTEVDIFYANVTAFLGRHKDEEWSLMWGADRMQSDSSQWQGLPQFIVGFTGISDELLRYFDNGDGKVWDVRLEQRWTMWNGLFSDDGRKKGYMIAWEVVPNHNKIGNGRQK